MKYKTTNTMKQIILCALLLNCLPSKAQIPIPNTIFDQVIDSRFKADEPGGVALVAEGGNIIYQRAFGMANLELNIKMQPDMVFEIGSMTKQVTAVCILQLMEKGKLKLTDPIIKYIPDYPASWQQVTVEHLLTHTSGITDGGARPNVMAKEMISQYQNKPLSFAPGSKWAYSSTGYAVLGAIIENVSGISYEEYVQKNIVGPLALTHTYFAINPRVIPNRVPSYLGARGRFRNAPRQDLPLTGAGALISNPADMLKWTEALVSGKVISKETLAKAWTSYQLTNGRPAYYGYGWQTGWKIQGSPIVEHSGLAEGYTTDAVYLPNEDVYVAVFMNIRGIIPELVVEDLAAIALGKPDDRHAITLSDELLRGYTGVYSDRDSSLKYLTVSGHQLYYQRADGPKMKMIPYAKDHFFFDNTSMIGTINRDNAQQIISLQLIDKRNPDKPWHGSELKRTKQLLPIK